MSHGINALSVRPIRIEKNIAGWRQAAIESFKRPIMEDGALAWARKRNQKDLDASFSQALLVNSPNWKSQEQALRRYFSLTNDHCLNVTPHRWANLHEPQITAAFAHFLSEGSGCARRAKIWALIQSVWGNPLPFRPGDITNTQALSEAKADRKCRIDLLVTATVGQEVFAVVMEAKFHHFLKEHQIQVYQSAASKIHNLDANSTRLLVVAPCLTAYTQNILRGTDWVFLTWERLIVRLEESLVLARTDDSEFRRFRRTIWQQAIG